MKAEKERTMRTPHGSLDERLQYPPKFPEKPLKKKAWEKDSRH
jgi:hypothetical protein